MPSIGELDRRITIERATSVTDPASGEPILTWSTLATVWASRSDVTDGEKLAGGQVLATLVSRFVVRSTPITKASTPLDRLTHDGEVWEITGIKETRDGRNRFIEVSTARSV